MPKEPRSSPNARRAPIWHRIRRCPRTRASGRRSRTQAAAPGVGACSTQKPSCARWRRASGRLRTGRTESVRTQARADGTSCGTSPYVHLDEAIADPRRIAGLIVGRRPVHDMPIRHLVGRLVPRANDRAVAYLAFRQRPPEMSAALGQGTNAVALANEHDVRLSDPHFPLVAVCDLVEPDRPYETFGCVTLHGMIGTDTTFVHE